MTLYSVLQLNDGTNRRAILLDHYKGLRYFTNLHAGNSRCHLDGQILQFEFRIGYNTLLAIEHHTVVVACVLIVRNLSSSHFKCKSAAVDVLSYCIEAGKHVHLDKPAGDLKEYKYILDTARANGLVVQLGYMYRYNPAVVKCLELINEGALGEIYSINAEMSTNHPSEYRTWLKNFGGGIMYILGSHLVDLIVYMLGKPDKITSFLKNTQRDGVDVEDNNLAVLEYGNTLARIFVSSVEVNGFGRRQLVVSGSKGTVNICPLERPITLTFSNTEIANKTYEDCKITIPFDDNTADGRYDEMMKDFYAYVLGEKENPYTYEHDYLVQKVIDEMVGGVHFNGNKID